MKALAFAALAVVLGILTSAFLDWSMGLLGSPSDLIVLAGLAVLLLAFCAAIGCVAAVMNAVASSKHLSKWVP